MNAETNCRHEYVIIYQRKLKGLDRRLVGTRAFLPVGFKAIDFKHLSPGSFCFCTRCRKRLFPRRSPAEKEMERQERKRAKAEAEAAAAAAAYEGLVDDSMPFGLSVGAGNVLEDEEEDQEEDQEEDEDFHDDIAEGEGDVEDEDDAQDDIDIHVDELEVESVDVEDIKAEGVKLSTDDDESCALDDDEES